MTKEENQMTKIHVKQSQPFNQSLKCILKQWYHINRLSKVLESNNTKHWHGCAKIGTHELLVGMCNLALPSEVEESWTLQTKNSISSFLCKLWIKKKKNLRHMPKETCIKIFIGARFLNSEKVRAI